MKAYNPQVLASLRRAMHCRHLDALHISGTDPHMSEYLCDHWQVRRWVSGFTGSYGEVVVTMEEAILWTDTRYFLQAEAELAGSGFRMLPLRVPQAVGVEQWLAGHLPAGSRVGFDPYTLPLGSYRALLELLTPRKITLVPVPELIGEVWTTRPPLPAAPLFELETALAGATRSDKRAAIVDTLARHDASATVITSLSELAWCFNLRGEDIPYNPVFLGYGLIGSGFHHLFVQPGTLPASLEAKLLEEGITLAGYAGFMNFLGTLRGMTLLIDPASASCGIFMALREQCRVVEAPSPVEIFKAIKNNTELKGFRESMQRDGVALVAFLHWLSRHTGDPGVTEYTVGRHLAAFRAKQPGFRGESFKPIIGYREHGAVVHLTVDQENALPLEKNGVLLFDSGGQYLAGTTDITRTVALGAVTPQQKRDFTLVLKGVIALTEAVFPEGTRGIHLDILARRAMWQHGIDYGHGTGHGVGHFLSVHEGPAAIRREWNPHEIKPGMVFSNEPGIYRTGAYGIRIENMMVCVEKETTPFGKFLAFETLTLCPIDTRLVELSLLLPQEVEWLNRYHRQVRKSLMPFVSEDLRPFLEELTAEIHCSGG